jgi:hypothetical protein
VHSTKSFRRSFSLLHNGVVIGAAFAFAASYALAQSVPVVTGDARVDKLLSQMTLQEKLTLIHGTQEDPSVYQGQAGYLAGIPRLHIPGLRFADGPPGVLTRHPSQGETATTGVAATFSIKDAEDNGLVIGREDRALGIDVSLQPFVNIDRDLEFGRGYNTFGEDPFLTSQMGVAEVKGIQSQHVMAQIKHYVGYDSDNENTYIDDQTLHEVYLRSTLRCSCKSRRLVDHVFLQPPQWHLRLRQQGHADKHPPRSDRLQGLRHLGLGRYSRRQLHQCRTGYGDAGRTRSQGTQLHHHFIF